MKIALLSTETNAKNLQKTMKKYSDQMDFIFVFEETPLCSNDFLFPIYKFLIQNDNSYSFLLEKGIDFVLVYGWNYLISTAILDKIPFFNIHPSLLPQYRGPIPIIHQLLNQEKVFGVTIHKMDARFDEGPIFSQKSITISRDNYYLVYFKITGVVLQLVDYLLNSLVNVGFKSSNLELFAQNNETASYFSYDDLDKYIIDNFYDYKTFVRTYNILKALGPIKVRFNDEVKRIESFSSFNEPGYQCFHLVDQNIFVRFIE